MQRAINIISAFILVAAGLMLTLTLAALLWPYKVCELSNLEILTEEVRAGESITFAMDVKKFTTDTAISTISIQDGSFYNLLTSHVSSLPGTFTTMKAVLLNIDIPPGTYHIVVDAIYEVNPIRKVKVRARSVNTIRVVR